MTSRLREFQELAQSSSAGAGRTHNASVERQEHVDALRRRRKRRLAMAQAASTSGDVDVSDPDIDVWTLEAARIASSVASLSLFLSSVRRAYLDLASSSSLSTAHSYGSKGKSTAGNRNKGELDLSKGVLEAWKDVKWLSDRERDEVDWQAKTTLKKCMNRVKQLEQAENNRHTRAMQALSTLSANNISRLLGLPALQASEKVASEEVLHSHRQQVTLYLSRRLADVGHTQQEQQELRVHRQLEKQNMSSKPVPQAGSNVSSKGGKSSLEETVPSMYIPAPIASGSTANGYSDDEDDRPIDQMLSQAQIQQFESESSALLQEANSQLASIEKAQTSLLEISNLQSELAVHLTQQMEITDKLWEDSVLVSGRVEEGNKQLRQARDRNREGRLWLLIFMLGASFSLLFLEYY